MIFRAKILETMNIPTEDAKVSTRLNAQVSREKWAMISNGVWGVDVMLLFGGGVIAL